MSVEKIRTAYDVPARVGGRVTAYGKDGTIVGSRGAYLRIRIDGERRAGNYHPTDGIVYRAAAEKSEVEAPELPVQSFRP